MFHLVRRYFRSVQIYLFRFTRTLNGFSRQSLPRTDYMFTFWAKLEQEQGSKKREKFESTLIGFAVMSKTPS